ncbi:hypothetical protein [Thermoplasma sp.]|uniref:hypothetical protein n=1 Tax=Thermoplasma sp. TaxID=1973142 RepID=UPI00127917B8|nr:hypothetical protein [Thermoplasma sp.]KAA8922435.1 MAG: hypothetical protein F6Q11_04240 [Thermoplasma sp.]
MFIKIDGREAAEISLSENKMKVTLKDPRLFSAMSDKIPHRLEYMKLIEQFSKILSKLRLNVELDDERGSILKMGYMVHSVLGNFKISLRRSRRYL